MEAIIYRRVSTDEQADSGAGLSAQAASLAAEVAHRGWTIAADYADEGVSGSVSPDRRPALAAALADLDAGRADVLVVAKLDRLSRSVVDLALLLDRAERGAVVARHPRLRRRHHVGRRPSGRLRARVGGRMGTARDR
jgi:DNA invertase Pin-like site-specific DNA recombinase